MVDEILSTSTSTDVQEFDMDETITLESSAEVAFEPSVESTHKNCQNKGTYIATYTYIFINYKYM